MLKVWCRPIKLHTSYQTYDRIVDRQRLHPIRINVLVGSGTASFLLYSVALFEIVRVAISQAHKSQMTPPQVSTKQFRVEASSAVKYIPRRVFYFTVVIN